MDRENIFLTQSKCRSRNPEDSDHTDGIMSDLLDTNEPLTKNESSEFVKKKRGDSDNAYVECMKKMKICGSCPIK